MYGRSKKFNKKTNLCTNSVDRCHIKDCLSNVWKYNFEDHFDEKHAHEEQFPPGMVISDEEKKHLLK